VENKPERLGAPMQILDHALAVPGLVERRTRIDVLHSMKAVNAKEFDMVATWSVERLGRSLTDLLSILQAHTDLKKGARIVALTRSLYSGSFPL
jgi:hypothetical protein